MDLLKSIHVFRTVCAVMSFSQAAAQLNLVPSAVSRQVSELEKYLGVRLLQRTTRSIHLTEEGRQYLEKMTQICEYVNELTHSHKQEKELSGQIRITAPPILGAQFLNTVIPVYLKSYPNVSINVVLLNREVNLVEEGYDLAIRIGTLSDSSLIARKIAHFPLSIVASPSYLAMAGEPQHPKDLVQHNCLINTLTQAPYRWQFRESKRHFSIKVAGRFEANDDEMLQSLASAGAGIAYLPTYFVKRKIDTGELIPILERFVKTSTYVFIVYPTRQFINPIHQAFIEQLLKSAQNFSFEKQ